MRNIIILLVVLLIVAIAGYYIIVTFALPQPVLLIFGIVLLAVLVLGALKYAGGWRGGDPL